MPSEHQDIIDLLADKPYLKDLFLEVGLDSQLTQLLQELISVTDDDRPLNGQVISRSTIFERTERFIQCSRKVDEVDNTDDQGQPRQPTQFVPPLAKGQLIKAKFSAVGSELDREHFAIVWDAIPNRDSIQVIPTESMKSKIKETKHRFSIGKIRPLSLATAVCMEQITCISRKRIVKTEFTKQNIPVYLSSDQEKRIEEGIRVMLLNEESLLEHLIKNNLKFIPQFDNPAQQLTHLLRPLMSKSYDKKVLTYTLYNDSTEYKITWVKTSLKKERRVRTIQSLANVIDTDTKDRITARNEIYQKMLETVIS
ncbi:hypothetical protein CD30_15300 [Ureibacillus massiliensis 4400831 = CIP 108448 = CCUG 49529]|uniref:Uncharacterized protein n=1 Tax=Ureibacillus massiliensis 4400831 = CIP 108448 = CCUG 49529 TaxID=1211035 RepID=A0A0A3IYG9_9BACL|nr:hypothetical protein [Ureibacillus massiliensis]KGR89789.1 hypothetical protein CD30_15300 [Ureibacillus massiliensis 4400831 = CIP 108448 = CCUG 49529]